MGYFIHVTKRAKASFYCANLHSCTLHQVLTRGIVSCASGSRETWVHITEKLIACFFKDQSSFSLQLYHMLDKA